MTFTEADAENDGLIKREVGKQLKSIAARELPQLYQHFERVANARGREPADILGERVVRALEDEEYAERLFNTQVNLMELEKDNIRKDDIEFVQDLAESLGLNEEQQDDPINRLVMERIESRTKTPLSGFSESVDKSQDMGELKAYLESTNKRLQQMEKKMEQPEPTENKDDNSNHHTGEQKSVDDIFGGSDESEDVVEEEPEPEPEEVEPEPTSTDDVMIDAGQEIIEEPQEEDEVEQEIEEIEVDEDEDFINEDSAEYIFGSEEMEEDQ